jgi:multidrug resistance efflux pump
MTKRDEYVAKLKQQLDQCNAEITKWEAKAKGAQAGLEAEYEKQLQALRQHRDNAMKQMGRVQSATEEAWADLKQGTDDAWGKMREAFDKARSRLQK